MKTSDLCGQMYSVRDEDTCSSPPGYSTAYLATVQSVCAAWRVCLWMWWALHPRTWMSLVWPLAYVWTHYLWQHSGAGTPAWSGLSSAAPHLSPCHKFRTSSAVLVHPLTLPLWTRQRPLKGCPCLIPQPHFALMARVYLSVQIRLEETFHDGEIDRKNQFEPHQWGLSTYNTCLLASYQACV